MAQQTYYSPKLYKTNAPPEVVYDIFKAYVRLYVIMWFIEIEESGWRYLKIDWKSVWNKPSNENSELIA